MSDSGELAVFLNAITFWHWFIFGCALVVLEIFVPGIIFVWLGIAAFVLGFLKLIVPALSWEVSFIVFSVLSVVSVFLGRLWIKKRQAPSDHPLLNRRGEQYVGRVFTLDDGMVNGVGKLHIDDTLWKVSGENLAAGSAVKVVGVDGVVLKIEKT